VSAESNDFVTLARVLKTQGRHGEVAVEVHSDIPDRFVVGMKLSVLLAASGAKSESAQTTEVERVEEKSRRDLEIEALWPHKGLLVLKFAGIDSISGAEKLVGAELQVPRSERSQLEPGWTYVSDLVGCALFDRGREIGRIDDVQFGAGEAPLLVVSARGEQVPRQMSFEIPFAEAYLESVDLARQEVRMNLPEGMLEINAPMTEEEKREQAGASGRGSRRSKSPPRVRRSRR
jgi:16S rRNA processing protein RimM